MEAKHTKLGALVRAHREDMGISQQKLAELAGVSRESVNRLENGTATGPRGPYTRNVAKVLNAAGVSVPEVTDTVDDPQMFVALVADMETLAEASFSAYTRQRGGPASPSPVGRADLVLLSPSGVTIVAEVKAPQRQAALAQRELSEALTPAGWVVSSPV